LIEVSPIEIARCRRAAAEKGSGGGEDRDVAVGIVDKPFLHGAGEVDQRGDVPIGILLGVEPLIQAGAGDAEVGIAEPLYGDVVVDGSNDDDLGGGFRRAMTPPRFRLSTPSVPKLVSTLPSRL
jgi:hypothetical protein